MDSLCRRMYLAYSISPYFASYPALDHQQELFQARYRSCGSRMRCFGNECGFKVGWVAVSGLLLVASWMNRLSKK